MSYPYLLGSWSLGGSREQRVWGYEQKRLDWDLPGDGAFAFADSNLILLSKTYYSLARSRNASGRSYKASSPILNYAQPSRDY